jgi:hypothetical protein
MENKAEEGMKKKAAKEKTNIRPEEDDGGIQTK